MAGFVNIGGALGRNDSNVPVGGGGFGVVQGSGNGGTIVNPANLQGPTVLPSGAIWLGGSLAEFLRFAAETAPQPQDNALLQRLIARRNAPGERTQASITWGGPSDILFQAAPDKVPTTGVIQGGGPADPDDGEPPELVYNEIERSTHEKRVTNPEDPDSWVDVEVIDDILFRGPDGRRHRFVLDNA